MNPPLAVLSTIYLGAGLAPEGPEPHHHTWSNLWAPLAGPSTQEPHLGQTTSPGARSGQPKPRCSVSLESTIRLQYSRPSRCLPPALSFQPHLPSAAPSPLRPGGLKACHLPLGIGLVGSARARRASVCAASWRLSSWVARLGIYILTQSSTLRIPLCWDCMGRGYGG